MIYNKRNALIIMFFHPSLRTMPNSSEIRSIVLNRPKVIRELSPKIKISLFLNLYVLYVFESYIGDLYVKLRD